MSFGSKAEKRSAKRMGGSMMPASGALDGAKGDFNLPEFKVDTKATEDYSRSLKFEELEKLTQEAAMEGRTPALNVVFASGNGQPRPNGSWVIIPEWAFKEITEED